MNVNEYKSLANSLYGYNKQNKKAWRSFDAPRGAAEIFKNYFLERHIPFEASENYDLTHFECFATLDEMNAFWGEYYDTDKIQFMTPNEVRQAVRRKPFNGTPFIVDVIFNEPATIVFWSDGTKTVVKAQNGEKFDKEKGLAMAIIKKSLGNKGSYFNEIKKWTGEI